MQALQTIREGSPSNSTHEFTIERQTRTYLDSVKECIDARAADAQSEIAQAIRVVRRISDEFSVDERFEREFDENLTKATLALAAALGHVLEIVENTNEMKERLGADDEAA
jgi:hypothetical protein